MIHRCTNQYLYNKELKTSQYSHSIESEYQPHNQEKLKNTYRSAERVPDRHPRERRVPKTMDVERANAPGHQCNHRTL